MDGESGPKTSDDLVPLTPEINQTPTPEKNPVPIRPDNLVCIVQVGEHVHQVALNKRQRAYLLGFLVQLHGGTLVLDKQPIEGMSFKIGRDNEQPKSAPSSLVLPPGHGRSIVPVKNLPPGA